MSSASLFKSRSKSGLGAASLSARCTGKGGGVLLHAGEGVQ